MMQSKPLPAKRYQIVHGAHDMESLDGAVSGVAADAFILSLIYFFAPALPPLPLTLPPPASPLLAVWFGFI